MTSTIKRAAFGMFGVVFAATLLTSCLKDGTDTIVLPLPDGTIPHDVISSDLQDSLRRHGFIINEGIEPPTINGRYVASPMVQDYASDGVVLNYVDVEMAFSKQLERGLIKYTETQRTPNGGSMTSEYYEANIIGSGDKFTVYSWQYDNGTNVDGSGWRVKTATVISGTWTAAGIQDCQYSVLVLEKENDTYNRIPSENTYRIYHDGDNMATILGNEK